MVGLALFDDYVWFVACFCLIMMFRVAITEMVAKKKTTIRILFFLLFFIDLEDVAI
jgi:hypothetical protein